MAEFDPWTRRCASAAPARNYDGSHEAAGVVSGVVHGALVCAIRTAYAPFPAGFRRPLSDLPHAALCVCSVTVAPPGFRRRRRWETLRREKART